MSLHDPRFGVVDLANFSIEFGIELNDKNSRQLSTAYY
jgi:hypothetical protein